MAQTDGVLSLIIKLSCSFGQDTFLTFFFSTAASSRLHFSLLILCLPSSNTVCEQILGQDPRKVKGPQGFSEGSSAASWSHPTCSAGSRLWQSERQQLEARRGGPAWALGCSQPISVMLLLPLMAPFPLPPAASRQC